MHIAITGNDIFACAALSGVGQAVALYFEAWISCEDFKKSICERIMTRFTSELSAVLHDIVPMFETGEMATIGDITDRAARDFEDSYDSPL